MADYRYTDVGVIRLFDSLHIYPDRSNPNWLAYLDYVLAGGLVDPPLPPVIVPIPLDEAKARKRSDIGHEAAVRVSAVIPGEVSIGTLVLMREMYQSIAPAARAPTAKWTSIGSIVNAAVAAVELVNAATTVAAVDAIAVTWP